MSTRRFILILPFLQLTTSAMGEDIRSDYVSNTSGLLPPMENTRSFAYNMPEYSIAESHFIGRIQQDIPNNGQGFYWKNNSQSFADGQGKGFKWANENGSGNNQNFSDPNLRNANENPERYVTSSPGSIITENYVSMNKRKMEGVNSQIHESEYIEGTGGSRNNTVEFQQERYGGREPRNNSSLSEVFYTDSVSSLRPEEPCHERKYKSAEGTANGEEQGNCEKEDADTESQEIRQVSSKHDKNKTYIADCRQRLANMSHVCKNYCRRVNNTTLVNNEEKLLDDEDNGENGSNGCNGTTCPDNSNGSNCCNDSNSSNGSNGCNGCNGSNGNGSNGSNGCNGCNGSNGSNGSNGCNGCNGSNGSNGSNGCNGCNGSNGSNGSNGCNGCNGSNGSNGCNGCNGSNGSNGSNGCYGCNGSNNSTEKSDSKDEKDETTENPPCEQCIKKLRQYCKEFCQSFENGEVKKKKKPCFVKHGNDTFTCNKCEKSEEQDTEEETNEHKKKIKCYHNDSKQQMHWNKKMNYDARFTKDKINSLKNENLDETGTNAAKNSNEKCTKKLNDFEDSRCEICNEEINGSNSKYNDTEETSQEPSVDDSTKDDDEFEQTTPPLPKEVENDFDTLNKIYAFNKKHGHPRRKGGKFGHNGHKNLHTNGTKSKSRPEPVKEESEEKEKNTEETTCCPDVSDSEQMDTKSGRKHEEGSEREGMDNNETGNKAVTGRYKEKSSGGKYYKGERRKGKGRKEKSRERMKDYGSSKSIQIGKCVENSLKEGFRYSFGKPLKFKDECEKAREEAEEQRMKLQREAAEVCQQAKKRAHTKSEEVIRDAKEKFDQAQSEAHQKIIHTEKDAEEVCRIAQQMAEAKIKKSDKQAEEICARIKKREGE